WGTTPTAYQASSRFSGAGRAVMLDVALPLVPIAGTDAMRSAPWFGLLFLGLGIWAANGTSGSERLASGDAGDVLGRVVEDAGPVAGARVHFQGPCPAARTDRDGRFRLPRPGKGPGRVAAWKEGYAISTRPADRLPLLLPLTRLPKEDNEDYAW